ncbi:LacI family DNA-binding transcriptional regulator [Natronosporangium hydrolyticum]|uniref:LacI family DNA-binding transcriptional regulator n=1 Tax=Natronosporangium hydrolyticum TaxID=2811111 RepID=A0A895YBF7_9ACTN|nr:LacI family DNA-binding transcriptional regulator [Natronosporangium hydrolyticum]QSB13615.1 LacI family DNA-binding transcriptional regulator [Natronosporangium hydrolyticum]
MKRPTIADIARRAGVSKGAVSYALNGQPGVSEATRQRVLTIAEEIGWNPNSAARALSGAAANAIGLALRRPARVLGLEPFYMELISGVEAELATASYGLMLQVVADSEAEIGVYRRWWGERRVDGVLICDLRLDDPRVKALTELELPAVVIGGPDGVDGLANTWNDDGAALAETVEYLAALGHRRLGRVAGLSDLRHTRVRAEAFDQACRRLALTLAVTESTDYSGEQGAQATRRLLSGPDRPTALIYDNDVMAIAGLSVAQEMGLAVPGDVSIVAFDDSPLCRLVHPPLTALTRDIPAHGARAARQLLDVISGAQPPMSQQMTTARLTPRGSTAKPAPTITLR